MVGDSVGPPGSSVDVRRARLHNLALTRALYRVEILQQLRIARGLLQTGELVRQAEEASQRIAFVDETPQPTECVVVFGESVKRAKRTERVHIRLLIELRR